MKEISPSELTGNVFDEIGKTWMLVTAGDEQKANTMTASWGRNASAHEPEAATSGAVPSEGATRPASAPGSGLRTSLTVRGNRSRWSSTMQHPFIRARGRRRRLTAWPL